MPSGWGEEDARGTWYANQDFMLKNLTVKAGSRLPDGWQVIQNVKYLREAYGADCVIRKTPQQLRAEMAAPEVAIPQAPPAVLRDMRKKL